MDNKEQLEELYNLAIEKFNFYIKTVYELFDHKNKDTIANRADARKEWQNAIKAYYDLLSKNKN